jgi:hypothetical protein
MGAVHGPFEHCQHIVLGSLAEVEIEGRASVYMLVQVSVVGDTSLACTVLVPAYLFLMVAVETIRSGRIGAKALGDNGVDEVKWKGRQVAAASDLFRGNQLLARPAPSPVRDGAPRVSLRCQAYLQTGRVE